VEGVKDVHVELVWDPPWTPDRISPELKEELGL
jgi:metal-sulfur cluster biosynthetic enzyme